jgi:hypothetical protein
MFTYGYIREAVMAHLDIDEIEAQDNNLLSRFHIFANEAMQAICASKPMYQYIDVTVVEKFDPIVTDGSFFRNATVDEINRDVETQGELGVTFLDQVQLQEYYHALGIYEIRETLTMKDTFIAFANKQCYKLEEIKPSPEDLFKAEAFNKKVNATHRKIDAKIDDDFSYIGKNKIKFYKPGKYLIPAKYMWYRFDSGIADDTELDMPSDILLTIPLYIASICLQSSNVQKAQLLRNEFELALSRCTASDMMALNKVPSSW